MAKFKEKMKQDMEIRGYSPRTVQVYLEHMRNFVKFHMISPDLLTLKDINAYQVYLVNVRKISYSSFNLTVCAIKLFYSITHKTDWDIKQIPFQKKAKKLPVVISKEDIVNLFDAANNLKHRAILETIYSTGARLMDLVNLTIPDIDSKRMIIMFKNGKGRVDRCVMLSKSLLNTLRIYYKSYRQYITHYLFPGNIPGKPISRRRVQAIVHDTAIRANIKKKISPHVLRHCFSTHLLEDGVNIRVIQKLLGHRSLRATEIYTHVAKNYLNQTKSPLDTLPNAKQEV